MDNFEVLAKGHGSPQARFAEGDLLKDYFERNEDEEELEQAVDQEEIDRIIAAHKPPEELYG